MERGLGLFAIGLAFGGGLGVFVAAANGLTLDGHDHGIDPDGAHADHAQDAGPSAHAAAHDTPFDVDASTAPSIALALFDDSVSGRDLHVTTTGFTFAPPDAGARGAADNGHAHVTGHAHVYVDGQKISRLYGPWMHIPALAPGDHVLRVTLNTNDHCAITVDGTPISAEALLTAK